MGGAQRIRPLLHHASRCALQLAFPHGTGHGSSAFSSGALFGQLAGRNVLSVLAGGGARGYVSSLRARLAIGQRLGGKHDAAASKRQELLKQWREFRSAAIVNSATLSEPGQNLWSAVAPVLPPILLYMLFPERYAALAYSISSREAFEREMAARRAKAPKGVAALLLAALPSVLRGLWEEAMIALRAVYLGFLFMPALLMAPLVVALGWRREEWLRLITWTLEQSGPAFIKWGQWASTRPDLFPEDLCDKMEQLQSSAPSHAGRVSVATIEAAFNRPIGELFSSFELVPVASGSIAQIHRATLSKRGAELAGCAPGTVVAIKVRHPRVSTIMHRDFILMQRAAALCSALPALRELRLEESIRQFGGPLKEQLDLSVEASHLRRFNANFRSWSSVVFPLPLFPLVSQDVLVESFENGELINRYVRGKHRHNEVLAQTGVDMFLKMMLADNFIHADLHPGNILVKEASSSSHAVRAAPGAASTGAAACSGAGAGAAHASGQAAAPQPQQQSASGAVACRQHSAASGVQPGGGSGCAAQQQQQQAHHHDDRGACPASAAGGSDPSATACSTSGRSSSSSSISWPAAAARWALGALDLRSLGWLGSKLQEAGHRLGLEFQPQIVLLDTGMIVELSADDKDSLLRFFKCLTKMDGEGLGNAILTMAVGKTCKNPPAFKRDIAAMFVDMDREYLREQAQVVFKDVIETMRQHQVTLRSSVSTVVVTSLVLEGWSSKMDPNVKILETMRAMLAVDWSDRISLAVDKIMASGALALA